MAGWVEDCDDVEPPKAITGGPPDGVKDIKA